MAEPKVSIVVPIYNVEKYLQKCLDSLINQTLEDIEIIQNYGWDESDHSAQEAIKQFSVHTHKFV